ncbi:MAG: fibrobacter succinogenes major paralogous domain-containing protein, partial [Bacteroidota bacterium]
AYGNEVSFTTSAPFSCGTSSVSDIDGNSYTTVSIGTQCWMKENLKTSRYRNGGLIPNVTTDNTAWVNLTTGAWSYYNNDVSNNAIYGKLYNWYTTLGDTLCPIGWGVPTDAEWTTLTTYLGGESVAGGKMKETGTTLWNDPNTGADNTIGFSGLPGGRRNTDLTDGSFTTIKNNAFFWSATELDYNYAWLRSLLLSYGGVYRFSSDLNK